MELQWQMIEHATAEAVQRLAEEMNMAPLMARILLNRGLEDSRAAAAFLNPDFSLLHDPFLMTDMDRAVSRVARAIANKEPMLIYGDYDVDGITGTAMLALALKNLGQASPFFVPDRIRDGYGLSRYGIQRAKDLGVTFILAVDCGVTAVKEIAMARELGIEVVACDHHQPEATLPNAYALLNPKRSDCPYPFKELSGVGVAFKLVQGLYQYLGRDAAELRKYLELVAIGSAADIVPLVGENRILVRFGLEQLSQTENLGLRALMSVCGLSRSGGSGISSSQVVFILAPRINAVGRMGDAARAVRLLMSEDKSEAAEIANILETENRQRRNIDDETFQSAIAFIESSCDVKSDPAFVLYSEDWHPGVIGIVASRLVEKYYRPTVMIAGGNGIAKGSARSIPGFDIHHALSRCQDLMLAFGGHKYAAGLTIRTEQIAGLRQRLQSVAAEMMTPDLRLPKLRIDGEVRFGEINPPLMRFLQQLAPFGPQNMRPVFVSRKVKAIGTPRVVGNNHLRFKASQDNRVIDAIGFNLGHLAHRLSTAENNVELAYLIEENEWQGQISTQLRIKDIR
jgi:single-stranded-DNA-specific exonuclease